MFNVNCKLIEGAVIRQADVGCPKKFSDSQDYISGSGGYDSIISLNDMSLDECADFLKNHVSVVLQSSQVSNKYYTAILTAQLCSNIFWETDIYCFQDLNIDINSTAVIKYAGVHHSIKNQGVMNNMLWDLEYYLFKAKKRYSVVSINLNNLAAVKSFLNAGYIIKAFDKYNPSGSKLVLFKDLEWSLGVNYALGFKRGGTAKKMRDKNYIANQVSINNSYKVIDVKNINEIENMLHMGYYPCDIINQQYICRQVKGHLVNNVVNIKEYADVA